MSATSSNLIDEAATRHQTVRELVEREYPTCRVTAIMETVDTLFVSPYDRADDRDGRCVVERIRFRVKALGRTRADPALECDVIVVEGGDLRIGDVTLHMGR